MDVDCDKGRSMSCRLEVEEEAEKTAKDDFQSQRQGRIAGAVSRGGG